MGAPSSKIRPEHQQRRAVVYIRQSSLQQVRDNLESQRLQYALVDRARSLGWSEVEVIDVDLGMSAGLGAEPRRGFDQLVGAVAQGQVGIVLARDVSGCQEVRVDGCLRSWPPSCWSFVVGSARARM